MKNFYDPHRNIHPVTGSFIIKNLLLHHLRISTLDFTADSPLMTKHTIPIPLLDTSQRSSLGKWRIASCALVLTLGQYPCFAQAGNEAPAQTASAAQPAAPDVAKELDAMKKRIEQLEAQLAAGKDKDKDKDKQASAVATATPAPAVTAAAAQLQTNVVTTATASSSTPASTNAAAYTASSSFWKRWLKQEKTPAQPAPVTTASLSSPPASAFDLRANAALDPNSPFPAGPQDAAAAPKPGEPPAPAAPPPVDNQTPFAFGDFTWMNAVSRNHDSVLDGKYFSPEVRTDV